MTVAVSKAQQRAVNKYMAANYDRINLTVPKGKKDTIQAHAEAQGQSVNAYINAAIDEKMSRETVGGSTRPVEAGVVFLPSDTLKAVQEASGEDAEQFIDKAIRQRVDDVQHELFIKNRNRGFAIIEAVIGEPNKWRFENLDFIDDETNRALVELAGMEPGRDQERKAQDVINRIAERKRAPAPSEGRTEGVDGEDGA